MNDACPDHDQADDTEAVVRAAIARVVEDCDDALAAQAARQFRPQWLDKHQSLLRQGEPWRHAVVVEHGVLRMHVVGLRGREFNKNFHLPGALVCPLTPAMETSPSLFGMSALEPTRVWTAPIERFRAVLDEHGLWAPLRTALLARVVSDKLQREHDLLTLDGRARYDKLCAERPQWLARIPLAHLASYLGLTDVSLSRLRRSARPATGND